MKFTFLFLNLAKIHIFIPKCTEGGGGSTGLENIPKKKEFLVLLLSFKMMILYLTISCDSKKTPQIRSVSGLTAGGPES